jgi:hypothetical protein
MNCNKIIIWLILFMWSLAIWWLIFKNFIKTNEG